MNLSKVKETAKNIFIFATILTPFIGITVVGWVCILQGERIEKLERDQLTSAYIWRQLVFVQARQVSVMEQMQAQDSVLASMAFTPFVLYIDSKVGGLQGAVDSLLNTTYRDSLSSKMKVLESVIKENPEKAMAIPLIRNNVDLLQKRLDQVEKAASDRMNTMTTAMMAFGGVVLVILIGLPASKRLLELTANKADKKEHG